MVFYSAYYRFTALNRKIGIPIYVIPTDYIILQFQVKPDAVLHTLAHELLRIIIEIVVLQVRCRLGVADGRDAHTDNAISHYHTRHC